MSGGHWPVTALPIAPPPAGGALRRSKSSADYFRMTRDPLRLLLFGLTLLTVGRLHQQYAWLARFRPALVLTAMVAAYAYMNRKSLSTAPPLSTWPAKLVAAMFGFACIAAPFGLSLGASGKFILEVYSKTVLYAFLLLVATRGARDLYTFVWAYVVSSALVVWNALFVFGLQKYDGYSRLGRMGTYDANDVGCVLLVGLCFAMLTLQVSGWVGKAVSVVVLAGIGATIARSGSRGAMIGLALTGVALLLLSRGVPVTKRVGLIAVLGLGLVYSAPPGYWKQMSTVLNPQADYNWTTTDGRKQLAERGIGYMLAYPIFGVGIDNFEKAECTISVKALNYQQGTGIRCSPPHNSIVQAGAELGIPGMLMWLTLLLGGITSMLRLRNRLPRAWMRGTTEERFLYLAPLYFATAMLGFAVTSTLLSFAWMDIAYFLAAAMGGLYVSAERRLRETGAIPLSPAAGSGTRRRSSAPVLPQLPS